MTLTQTTPAGADLAAARERNETTWRRMSTLFFAKRVEEALAHWHRDARYVAAYPVGGLPAVIEGRPALTELFAGLAAVTERIEVLDFHFHQTDDPDVAIIEERFTADLVDGGRYDNPVVMRLTFRDGLIAEMLEYYGEAEYEALLRRFGIVA
jgi:ketosteroid isomerase-like protein